MRCMAQLVSAKLFEYFAAFKCVGEVELATAAQMEDYALNIMVSARCRCAAAALRRGAAAPLCRCAAVCRCGSVALGRSSDGSRWRV